MRRATISVLLPLLGFACLGAEEHGDAQPAAVPAAAPAPDPTIAVVAQGAETYRQRDIDALVMIANRYHHTRLAPADEAQLRVAIAKLLIAREPLVTALNAMPQSMLTSKAGDAFLLDLIDYHPTPLPAESVPHAVPARDAPRAPAQTAAPATAAASGPMLVSLPPLVLTRTIDGEHRELVVGIAINFPDAATSKRFEEKAPIIRDAILSVVDGLSATAFREPRQADLKKAIADALQAKLPDFPAQAVLIPQLDASIAAEGDHAAPSALPAVPASPTTR